KNYCFERLIDYFDFDLFGFVHFDYFVYFVNLIDQLIPQLSCFVSLIAQLNHYFLNFANQHYLGQMKNYQRYYYLLMKHYQNLN
ncbi:hypothetical protein DEM28_24355, partial [Enterobacter mori]